MKAVLTSIQPKWVEEIASGRKTIEVRKTAPKCEVPFKCYIYATKGTADNSLLISKDGHHVILGDYRNAFNCDVDGNVDWNIGNAMVIGEFICDGIAEFESEFHDDNSTEQLRRVWYDEDDGERDAELFAEDGEPNYLCKAACLTWDELKNYIGTGYHTFYGWHISDLKIYDKPKELHEFKRECPKISIKRADCAMCPFEYCDPRKIVPSCNAYLKRPPQSWQYVEELQE